jgi:small subunit ribosomal protein S13
MVRLLGYTLSPKKPIYIALTVVYGIGLSRAKFILEKLNINQNYKVCEVSEFDLRKVNNYLENSTFKLEGDLKKFEYNNIKSLIDVNSFRGKRHLKGLPCRGQRTKTNSRSSRHIFKYKKKLNYDL